MTPVILVLNAGSSSLKFQVFEAGAVPRLVFRGLYEGLGGAARFAARSAEGSVLGEAPGVRARRSATSRR